MREQAPRFFAWLGAVADRLNAPLPGRLVLVPGATAALLKVVVVQRLLNEEARSVSANRVSELLEEALRSHSLAGLPSFAG